MRIPRTLFVSLVAVGMTLLPMSIAGASSKATTSHGSLPTIVIGDEGFTESQLMQQIYGDLLQNAGFKVSYQTTASRDIAFPALEKGKLDLVPDYAGSLLVDSVDPTAQKQAGTLAGAETLLNSILNKKSIYVLPGTVGLDQNVFVVTKATEQKYNLTDLSSVASHASGWTFGAPAECSTNYFCAPGLKKIYGITFKKVNSYDESGPLTVKALQSGNAQVVELFSTDPVIAADGFYQLKDDKNLEPADHLIPVIRKSFDTAAVQSALAKVNNLLTTSVLTTLDGQPSEGSHPTVAVVASNWLKSEHLIK